MDMPAEEEPERLDLALCDRLVSVLEAYGWPSGRARDVALDLVEIVFWARVIHRQSNELARSTGGEVERVSEICGVMCAELLEVAHHSRNARQTIERMLQRHADDEPGAAE